MNLSSALRTLADRVAEAEAAGNVVRASSINVHMEDDAQGAALARRVGIDQLRTSGPTTWMQGDVDGLEVVVFCEDSKAVSA
ncbi:MAG: hypothetical protein EOP24_39080 [Hyphomicrobiales bacterium]|nr:MAG: hypothetical protein EOP24_39080 [Hyphomicrobiales bacterium]